MITMIDEIYDRNYQAARAGLNAGIDRGLTRLARNFGDSLKVLHRIEWSAPWQSSKKPARRA